MNPSTPTRQALIKSYLTANYAYNSSRAVVKKQITAYNKANPNDRLTISSLIKERFPKLHSYFAGLAPAVPEDKLFENNFSKLLKNLDYLGLTRSGSTYYGNLLTTEHLLAAYNGGKQVFRHESGLTFHLVASPPNSWPQALFVCIENPDLKLYLDECFVFLQEA